jgi:hypothetical protein
MCFYGGDRRQPPSSAPRLPCRGSNPACRDLGVSVSEIKESEFVPILQKLGGMDAIDPATVAEFVENIQAGKFKEQVPE